MRVSKPGASLQDAKRRLPLNIISNLTYVVISALFLLWLTPYLIEHLGIELYGLIPLATAFVSYFNLVTVSISSSVGRYVIIHFQKADYHNSNVYLNSAFWALAGICIILAFAGFLLALNVENFFSFPPGHASDVGLLFFLVIVGALITAAGSPFSVSVLVNHRFDLDSYIKILTKLIQILSIYLMYEAFYPTAALYGVSYVLMSVVSVALLYLCMHRLTPQLKLNPKLASREAGKELGSMSTWQIVSQAGAALYLTSSIVIVNIFLGAEQAGKYAAIAQWVTLLSVLGGAISSIFAPIAYQYIAKGDLESLSLQISRAIKYITMAIGLPAALICGLSEPILRIWLGPDFTDLSGLMWIMIIPWVFSIGIRPTFAVFMGLNRVAIPALLTIIFGLLNVVITIVFIVLFNFGVYSVGYSLLICLFAKNFLFSPLYTAFIVNQKPLSFILPMVPGMAASLIGALTVFMVVQGYSDLNLLGLICLAMACTLAYFWFCVLVIFSSREDRQLIMGMVRRRKV